MKKTIALFITITCALIAACSAQAQLSIETLGVLRYDTKTFDKTWGASVGVGFAFNQFVTGRIRAVSYESDDWRGGVVDEGSALIEARLFQSANKAISLSAIGGADRDFATEDWGLSGGGVIGYALSKRVSLRLESRIRTMEQRNIELLSSAGLSFSF